MTEKLGIIAGGGDIPKTLIAKCKEQKRDYFVIALEDSADKNLIDETVPHIWIRLGQVMGSGFNKLKEEKVTEVIMIGTVRRPSVKDLEPDAQTAAFFAKLGTKSVGDDELLRAVVEELEERGMRVRGIQELLPDILIKEGVLGKVKPSKQALSDIERGVEVATELGRLDVGQAVIVQQGLVLGVEGIEGTGELIRRCSAYRRKGEGGVLVKIRKPQQDVRLDLPTIGDKTVIAAKESGLSGIVLHAGNGLIANEKETIKLADEYGIFVMGINPANHYEGKK